MSTETNEVAPKVPNLKLSDTTLVKCNCGSEVFQAGIQLRGVSALLSGTGKNEVIPTQIIYCAKCLTKYEPSQIITPA
jgi:hypothetical protein